MTEIKKPIEVQTKAVLIHVPGVGYVVKTLDGKAIAVTPVLAVDIANQILATEMGGTVVPGGNLPVSPARSSLLQ